MKAKTAVPTENMRTEYEFDYARAVRGKYYRRLLKEGASRSVEERQAPAAEPTR